MNSELWRIVLVDVRLGDGNAGFEGAWICGFMVWKGMGCAIKCRSINLCARGSHDGLGEGTLPIQDNASCCLRQRQNYC